MKVKLGDIAQLQFGLYVKPKSIGDAVYLQAKHFDDWGNQTDEVDTFVQIDQKKKAHLLEDGDIVYVSTRTIEDIGYYIRKLSPALTYAPWFF